MICRSWVLLFCFLPFAHNTFALQETWQAGYSGTDLAGPQVLGCWKFDGDSPLKDASGKGNDLSLQGALAKPEGKLGGCIESFPGFPVQDKRHAAATAANPKLSPKSAFTLEMWIKPKAEFKPELRCFLLDKKYVDHTGYQWQIGDADKGGLRRMWVNLGFAAESKTIYSQPLKFAAAVWQHVAFTYDGAGEGKFFLNGSAAGGAKLAGYGPVTPGSKPLSIGDRLGSNYGGFPGFIDEVRICEGALSFEQASLQIITDRRAWRRMETARPVQIVCTNLRRDMMKSAKLQLSLGGKVENFVLPDLASGKGHTATLAVNTALKPDRYPLRARLEIGGYETEQSDEIEIVARQPPRMPVIMWGAGGDEIGRLKDIGFTHFIGLGASAEEMWKQKKPLPPGDPEHIARNRRVLDEALASGLGVVASLSPGRVLESDPANLRADRAGKPYARQDICASTPEFAAFFENVGRSVARAYGDHPAFTTALIDTEVRDNTAVSFNAVDVENYRKFAAADIPAEVSAKWGVDWTKLKDFPADRVIADDHPILKYYRWFWTVGDGWNGLHSALHKGIKTAGRRDLWTFFDPAVRQPSISGAGGQADVLSHWTYTYPDPQRIGMCADQLFAMSAASGRSQQVMKMTQLIWYRSQTAPIGAKAPGEVVAWEDHDPDAAYITIAPMHLREALWTKLSRPVQGIMYHGWQSLVPTDSPGAYRFTNPNTVHELKRLIREVVEPLGPALMQVPDQRSEIAFFESFTSQMFARRGSYGSNNDWAADVWLALQHAHAQCDIVFEETLLKNGLSGRKVLVMPFCDVLAKPVVEKIAAWQKKGGKIIADEFLCPALKADLVLPSFKRTKKASEDKAKVLELAKSLRAQQAVPLPKLAECDNPEIVVRSRAYGDARYIFAINDHREPGSYVGQHGLVLESGLPSTGTISLPMEGATIYDLQSGEMIVGRRSEGRTSWPAGLGPCEGRIFLVMPKALLSLEVELPESAKAGNTAVIAISISNTAKEPAKAVIPVRIEIADADGRSAEGSGYHAVKDGRLELKLDIAANEDPGAWQIKVRELASRMEAVRWMKVSR